MNKEQLDVEATDLVVVEGINARGFGTVPKAVMRDETLPIEAKGIYSYLCSFAGGGQTAFPSRATMLVELGLSKDRFYKYRKMLVDRGLLRVERQSGDAMLRPVRTNVYVLCATMPECYRKPKASPAAPLVTPDSTNPSDTSSPQVSKNVLKTRTSPESFPQSAGQQECPCFKDVLETRTIKRPENKDTENARFPSSSTANAEPIINKAISNNDYPSILPDRDPVDIEREFNALASPEITPNRNRLAEARSLYRETRSRFPASVIACAWKRRQRDAREANKPARFFPQLARWLEDPGPDGAAKMCEAEAARLEKKAATQLSFMLSLDAGYMAMRDEAARIASLARMGEASDDDLARLNSVRTAMAATREEKRAELATSKQNVMASDGGARP